MINQDPSNRPVKPKRKRATSQQVNKLNEVFEQTFFPSSEVRLNLAMELGMTPRTVQIWFQNKRQGWRSEHNKSVPRDLNVQMAMAAAAVERGEVPLSIIEKELKESQD